MTNKLLSIIGEQFSLTPLAVGEFAKIKASGLTFSVEAYTAAGLGHVSVMKASGFFGLMKMDTLIINPKELDLPLYSYDRIFAMGNDTLIIEIYDTSLSPFKSETMIKAKDDFDIVPERDPGEHWYDSIKLPESISKKGKKVTPLLDELTLRHFEGYLSSEFDKITDKTAKQEKTRVYVDGLLEKGGPSTDAFIKAIGQEKTAELFKNYLFNTK